MIRVGLVCAVLCVGAACSGEDDGGVPEGGGEVTAPWDGFCVATFGRDYAFVDPFGDVELRVKAGSRYLLADVGGFGVAATVLYLTKRGPIELGIEVDDGAALPFTSSCTGNTVELVGAFSDVSVYTDEAKSMAACTLAAGSTHEGGLSYSLISGIFERGGTYQVSFGGLAAACGGITSGYVSAASVSLGATEYTVLPLASVLGPAP